MVGSWSEMMRALVSPEILILFALVLVGLATWPTAPRRKAGTLIGPIGTRIAAGNGRLDRLQSAATLAANAPAPSDREILLSDIQKSDLEQLGRRLDQILQALQASTIGGSVNIGRYIQDIASRMDDVRSLLREISNKLDRR